MLTVVDEISDQAKAVGAVNTVSFFPDRIAGDNTDVDGFAASIESARELFEGNSVLVLGAGGSARAILYTLLTKFRASEIIVANRAEERARELARHFRSLQPSTVVRSAQLSAERIRRLVDHANLIVNCTPVGMFPAIDESPVDEDVKFHSHQVLVDLIYTPLQTRLLSHGDKQGARTISGLEMFLHQGARSFEIWLGLHMPVDEIRPLIINKLNRQRRLEK
jgi:shikimate dehydrogenase